MIIRIWKGTTSLENSNDYEQLLRNVVFPGIQQKNISGYLGIQLLKNPKETNVDYVTIMTFEDWHAVTKFSGEDYEKSYVIDEAKRLLQSYDAKTTHYELLYNSISVQ